MGYDVHVTRAEDWLDSKEDPIPDHALREIVAADPSLSVSSDDWYERKTGDGVERIHPVVWAHPSGDAVCFWPMDGALRCKNPDDESVAKLLELARELDAHVVGDDGEHYGCCAPRKDPAPTQEWPSREEARGATTPKGWVVLVSILLVVAFALSHC